MLDNDPSCVSDVVDALLLELGSVGPGDRGPDEESASFHLRLSMQEMLLNAIEHGNLEISAQEKQHAIKTDRYDRLIADRRRDPRYAARRVRVRVMQDREHGVYECCIKDEGDGFSWPEWLAFRSSDVELDSGCGRGIELARSAAESMRYNEVGNEVTLIVRVHGALTA